MTARSPESSSRGLTGGISTGAGGEIGPHLPFQQHGVDVQEVDCEDPGGLGVQELPPGRARAARRRADASSSQDLIDGGRRDRHAELGQLAVDPAVAPTADSLSPGGRQGGRCCG